MDRPRPVRPPRPARLRKTPRADNHAGPNPTDEGFLKSPRAGSITFPPSSGAFFFYPPVKGLLKKSSRRTEGIPIIELFTVGTGLRACPDEGQPWRAGQARRPVPTKPSYPHRLKRLFQQTPQGGSDSLLSRRLAMSTKEKSAAASAVVNSDRV